MSGAHCARFPTCMEFSEKPKAPKCSKPDCPGAASWEAILDAVPAVADTRRTDVAESPPPAVFAEQAPS